MYQIEASHILVVHGHKLDDCSTCPRHRHCRRLRESWRPGCARFASFAALGCEGVVESDPPYAVAPVVVTHVATMAGLRSMPSMRQQTTATVIGYERVTSEANTYTVRSLGRVSLPVYRCPPRRRGTGGAHTSTLPMLSGLPHRDPTRPWQIHHPAQIQ